MSRAERRRRTKRAAKAARARSSSGHERSSERGAPLEPSQAEEPSEVEPDPEDAEVEPDPEDAELESSEVEPELEASEGDPELESSGEPEAPAERGRAGSGNDERDATESEPEVPEPLPGGLVQTETPRQRRRRLKRGERAGDEPADLDPSEDEQVRVRTTSELLFDGRADGPDPASATGSAGETAAESGRDAEEHAHPETAAEDDADLHSDEEVVSRTESAPIQGEAAPGPGRARPRGAMLVVLLLGVLVPVFVLVAAQLGWFGLAGEMVSPADEVEAPAEPPEDGWQPAFLLATVDDHEAGGQLRSLAVLATDRREDRGTVLLVPVTIVTDVPGFGSFTLREAWELGGSSLVAVTVDNLLGLRIDGVLAVDDEGWAGWFEQPGGALMDITSSIVPAEGTGQARVEPGTRELSPDELGDYAIIRGQGESALDVLPRTRQVLDALFAAISDDAAALEAVVDAARTYPGTATPERIRTVMGELAEARDRDRLTSVSLPVVPLGSGEEGLYRTDGERLDDLIDNWFATSRERVDASERWAVQILNGNGLPGVGQEVADELADGSYRIVLTGNADHFNYRTTRIVVYSEEQEILRAAQDVQERLGGIGTIERSGTPQSVVDLTIVVGHDFPP